MERPDRADDSREGRRDNPLIFLYPPNCEPAREVSRHLGSFSDCRFQQLVHNSPEGTKEPADLLLCFVGEGGNSLARASSLLLEQPWIQTVFICQGRGCPETEALISLGARFIVNLESAWPWLRAAFHGLIKSASARREMFLAEGEIPVPPPLPFIAGRLSLRQAEQRFREAYVRTVMARSSSQKEAAVTAGVPYTTFRSMLDKLMI